MIPISNLLIYNSVFSTNNCVFLLIIYYNCYSFIFVFPPIIQLSFLRSITDSTIFCPIILFTPLKYVHSRKLIKTTIFFSSFQYCINFCLVCFIVKISHLNSWFLLWMQYTQYCRIYKIIIIHVNMSIVKVSLINMHIYILNLV